MPSGFKCLLSTLIIADYHKNMSDSTRAGGSVPSGPSFYSLLLILCPPDTLFLAGSCLFWGVPGGVYKHCTPEAHFCATTPLFRATLLCCCPCPTGNFFFAGSRLFFGSLEAAVFQFSRVARIPEGSLVLPAIRTEVHSRV